MRDKINRRRCRTCNELFHKLDFGFCYKCFKGIDKVDLKIGIKRIDTRGLKITGRELTREAVRKRDNYKCQNCFKKWEKDKRRFDVHHLNGICGKKSRSYDKLSETNGLITLCHKCHLNLKEVKQKMKKKKSSCV